MLEEFCAINGIHFDRIKPDGEKIPDYDFIINDKRIVIEVKQMDPNPEEAKKIKEFYTKGTVTIRTEPGHRVRGKIKDAEHKFRRRTQEIYPSMLVIYDNVKHHKHAEPFEILAAMYGQPYFAVEYSGSNTNIGNMKHGPKQKMTSSANTSISAIGVIREDNNAIPMLTIFHNKYAEVPLDPDLFAQFSVTQYEVEEIDRSMKWKEISKGTYHRLHPDAD